MSPRTLRNALMLAGEAQRQIRAAGRTPPPMEYLLSAVMAHAKLVTRAARAAAKAERHAARAQSLARECASAALEMSDAVAAACIKSMPATQQLAFSIGKTTGFDPARHVVTLAAAPGASTPPLTRAELS